MTTVNETLTQTGFLLKGNIEEPTKKGDDAHTPLTSSVHTAGCERGFSVQNRILTTFRNRLTIEIQQKLMRVKIYHADQIKKMKDQSSDKAILNKKAYKKEVFDFNAALLKWKVSKDRRIYELKKAEINSSVDCRSAWSGYFSFQ